MRYFMLTSRQRFRGHAYGFLSAVPATMKANEARRELYGRTMGKLRQLTSTSPTLLLRFRPPSPCPWWLYIRPPHHISRRLSSCLLDRLENMLLRREKLMLLHIDDSNSSQLCSRPTISKDVSYRLAVCSKTAWATHHR
jgi:hypothetical protein